MSSSTPEHLQARAHTLQALAGPGREWPISGDAIAITNGQLINITDWQGATEEQQ